MDNAKTKSTSKGNVVTLELPDGAQKKEEMWLELMKEEVLDKGVRVVALGKYHKASLRRMTRRKLTDFCLL